MIVDKLQIPTNIPFYCSMYEVFWCASHGKLFVPTLLVRCTTVFCLSSWKLATSDIPKVPKSAPNDQK